MESGTNLLEMMQRVKYGTRILKTIGCTCNEQIRNGMMYDINDKKCIHCKCNYGNSIQYYKCNIWVVYGNGKLEM